MIAFKPTNNSEDRVMITKADIEACESVPQMLAWLGELEDTRGDLISTIEARKLTETDEQDWAIRAGDALTYASMGVKRLKRKLRALGVNPDPLPADDQASLERARSAARFATHLLRAMAQHLSQDVMWTIRDEAQAAVLAEA